MTMMDEPLRLKLLGDFLGGFHHAQHVSSPELENLIFGVAALH